MSKIPSTLIDGLKSSETMVRYDASCKRILQEKMLFALLLKSCIEEFRCYDVNKIIDCIESYPKDIKSKDRTPRILGMNSEDFGVNDGKVIFDICFYAKFPFKDDGVIVDIEAQNGRVHFKRAFYYASRLASLQYGRIFHKSHYDKICKVASIWIIIDPPNKKINSENIYKLHEKELFGHFKEKENIYNLMDIVLIHLGTLQDELADILVLLDTIFSEEISIDKKKEILQKRLKSNLSEKLEKELKGMCNFSEAIAKRNMKKGILQGREEGILLILRQMMKEMHLDANDVVELLNLPTQEKEKYLSLLR